MIARHTQTVIVIGNGMVFPVKVEGEKVFLKLPPERQLDALLATELHVCTGCATATS